MALVEIARPLLRVGSLWGACTLGVVAVGSVKSLMWAARLLPGSQQKRFAGAGGHLVKKPPKKSRETLAKERVAARQKEILRHQEDYVSCPVPKKDEEDHPWNRMAKSHCQSCSRKPVAAFCHRCGLAVCAMCITREEVAPYRWSCLDCAAPSDVSEAQVRLLVACQNEDVARRELVLPKPDEQEEEGLSEALAERILGNPARASEMAWWAEVKRKDWALYDDRPVMPMKAMWEQARGRRKTTPQQEPEGPLNAAGSKDKNPHPVKEELKDGARSAEREVEAAVDKVLGVTAGKDEALKTPSKKRSLDQGDDEDVDGYVQRLISTYSKEGAEKTPKGNPGKENDRVPKEPPSALRNRGPVQPPKVRARGSTQKALEVAKSEELMKKARMDFGELVYAKSTAAAKDSKTKLFVQIAEARNLQPFPLTPPTIVEVAAVLRAAEFASGATYLSEAKQLHVRKGFPWTEDLDLAMQDSERALTRALGPVLKAAEVPPVLWSEWAIRGAPGKVRKQAQPDGGPELWCFGSAFLLRETELAHLLMGSVNLDMDRKQVTAWLSMSKTDPQGRGARRTRACSCGKGPDDVMKIDCAFHSAVMMTTKRKALLKSKGYKPEEIKELPVTGQIDSPTLVVSKEAMIAALKSDLRAVLIDKEKHGGAPPEFDFDRVTGHTLRRSGAKDAARRFGMPLSMIQWLGRWGSSAVAGYVEDAMEEMPEHKVALSTWEGVASKMLEQTSKQEELEINLKAFQSNLKADNETIKIMVEELWARARPKLVLNMASMVLHATSKRDSKEWDENSLNWVTRCGGWRWGSAGRLAKPLVSKEQSSEALAICNKCRPDIIAEELLGNNSPCTF